MKKLLLAGFVLPVLFPAVASAGGPGYLPPAWVPNRGQWGRKVLFALLDPNYRASIERKGWNIFFPGKDKRNRIRMSLMGNPGKFTLVPGRLLPGKVHFLLGRDPSRWRGNLSRYGRLVLENAYPGVDILLLPGKDGFRFDIRLHPGARLEDVKIRVEGASSMKILPSGDLLLRCSGSKLRLTRPVSWTLSGRGEKKAIKCVFTPYGGSTFGFKAPEWEKIHPLTIDPTLLYSSYVCGGNDEYCSAVAMDSKGDIVLAGWTGGGLPSTGKAYDPSFNGYRDGFIARFDPSGARLLSLTYLGGTGRDIITGLALDKNGEILVTGDTYSYDFPVTPGAWSQTRSGRRNVFLSRLSGDCGKLLASAVTGGTMDDTPNFVSVGPSGNILVGGSTYSRNFPVTPGVFQGSNKTKSNYYYKEGFLFCCNKSETKLLFSTYVGGINDDSVTKAVFDSDGSILAAGTTNSPDFPSTPGTWNWKGPLGKDSFLLRLSKDAAKVLSGTFFGGSWDDQCTAMETDPSGAVVIAGYAKGQFFPVTANGILRNVKGSQMGFVASLDSSFKKVLYSTLLGGNGYDGVTALAVEGRGRVAVAGFTDSSDFPTTRLAPFRTYKGRTDAFLSRIDIEGGHLLFSTFLGGSGYERPYALALGPKGTAAVAGVTQSGDFPATKNALWKTKNSSQSYAGFIALVRVHEPGLTWYGSAPPACRGRTSIYAVAPPLAGSWLFGFECTHAPPLSKGFLFFGFKEFPGGFPILGARLFLDPAPGLVNVGVSADSNGSSSTLFGLAPGLRGQTVHAQYIWLDPSPCPGADPLTSSNALKVVIQ